MKFGRLEAAVTQAQAGKHADAVKAWDEAYMLYYGDGSGPYKVAGDPPSERIL